MITSRDIKKITDALITAQKDLFYTKPEIDKKFSRIINAIDSFVKDKITRDQEMAIMVYRLNKTQDWINKAAPKIGVEFDR